MTLPSDLQLLLTLPDGTAIVRHPTAKDDPPEVAARNLFRVAADGKMIWQVAAYQTVSNLSTFTGARLLPDGKLRAGNFDGGLFVIDLETGKIIDRSLGR